MPSANIRDGTVTLFSGTTDEIVIDPNSREQVTLPAYRLAELMRTAPPTDEPTMPVSFMVPYLVSEAKERLATDLAGAPVPVRAQDLTEAVTRALMERRSLRSQRTWERIAHEAVRIATERHRAQQKQKAARRVKRKAASDEERRIEERKQLYRDYGMQVPSTARIIASLDKPFIPSKRALKRKRALATQSERE